MTEWAGTTVIVAGAAGFIGANLTRSLAEAGADVHAPCRPNADLWRLSPVPKGVRLQALDLRDRAGVTTLVRRARPDFVFDASGPAGYPCDIHACGQAIADGIRILSNLLDAAGEEGVGRFVHLGSSLEYREKDSPLREDDPVEPGTLRGLVKAATSLFCRRIAVARRIPAVILRVFSVYGYWEGGHRLVPTLALAALRGGQVRLTGPGLRRDFLFIEDLIEACIVAARTELPFGEIINIGTGAQWSNEEAAAMVQSLSGRMFPVLAGAYPPREPDRPCWVADPEKARRMLGWRARHGFRDGMRKTIDWVWTNHACYPPTPLPVEREMTARPRRNPASQWRAP